MKISFKIIVMCCLCILFLVNYNVLMVSADNEMYGEDVDALAGATTWYFAEGSTNGYDTWIAMHNPSTSNSTDITLTYADADGNTVTETATIGASARYTRKINDVTGMSGQTAVSTKITSDLGIVAEQSMYWYSPYSNDWVGGHCSIGATAASTLWYFAEGSTSGYDTWLAIHNPDTTSASVTITYSDADGTTVSEDATIGASSRYTRQINAVTGMDGQPAVSTKITSDIGVVAQRSMYWVGPYTSDNVGGHCSIGAISASTTWYFAEGSTNGYDTWLAMHNPDTTSASVTITYSDADGNTVSEDATIGASCRYTRRINDVSGMSSQSSVSTKIVSDIGIVAERSMYWLGPYSADNAGGHCSLGAASAQTTWYFAEGSTNGFDTWLAIHNPNTSSASVTITYSNANGTTVEESATIGALSRYTRRINDVTGMGGQSAVSTKLVSTVGIVADRSMYWLGPYSSANVGGSCSVGLGE